MDDANEIFEGLNSKTAILVAVKEQHLSRYLGLGWVDIYHPWSKDSRTYLAKELLEYLTTVVIPFVNGVEVPEYPTLALPRPPLLPTLGTASKLAQELNVSSIEKLKTFVEVAKAERNKREAAGDGDRWTENQRKLQPEINKSLV